MLVGLCGRAGSGKDTVADFLVEEFGFVKMSFADKLKEICMDVFDLSHEQVHTRLKETVDRRYGKTPRQILQHIGTEGFRAVHDTVWIDCLRRRISTTSPMTRIVVSDVRFQNEAELFIDRGCLIKLERTGELVTQFSEHSSEAGVDLIEPHYTVSAHPGAIIDLKFTVMKMIRLHYGIEL